MFIGELLSLGCALSWAVGTICFKGVSERSHPLAMTLYECSISFLLFMPFLLIWESQNCDWSALGGAWPLVISALAGTIGGGFLFFLSLKKMGAANVAMVECLYAPLVIVLSYLFLSETLVSSQIIGVFAVVVAILVVCRPAKTSRISRKLLLQGLAAGVAGQILLAVSVVTMKPLIGIIPVMWVLQIRLFVALVAMGGALSLMKNRKAILISVPAGKDRFSFLMGALFCGFFATGFWVGGMKYLQASVSATIVQTSTVFTIVFAALFLKEHIEREKVLAVALALIGVVLVSV